MAHIDSTTARVVGAAEEINALLAELGVSQRELARRLGWTQPRIQGRLSGEIAITVADVEAIAAALGISADRIIPAPAPDGAR